jgi:Methyltransferase small domain
MQVRPRHDMAGFNQHPGPVGSPTALFLPTIPRWQDAGMSTSGPPVPPGSPLRSGDSARGLRDALTAAGFTVGAVQDLLGQRAHDALHRNETTPALRRTTGGSPLETLARLFLLQTTVSRADAERALPGLVDMLHGDGFLEVGGDEVRALLDCRPYADDDRDWWVVSDLTPGLDGRPIAVTADHVLGISPASTSLAQLTIRDRVGRALDLGTGCGVQALHLAGHADEVVATDVNQRALDLTAFNAALNEVTVDVRDGSLWDPVAGETYDLITTNPPFVISPATDLRLVYRDSGLPGDQVVEAIVRGAPAHLTDGGWCQVLANWAIVADRSWDERLAGWVADDCAALVVQREVLDPAAYVELWLKDAGRHGAPGYAAAYDGWLRWFDDQRIEGIGFGWLNLLRGGDRRTFLDWPFAVEQPISGAIRAWGEAVRTPVGAGDHLVLRVDVVQETTGDPGAEDPETIVLRQQRGLCRARQVDTVEAALTGACDGDLSVGQIFDALARILDRDAGELHAAYLPVVRELVDEGFLVVGD